MDERPNPFTFGELKTRLGQVVDRGRDSAMDDAQLGQYINDAEQWICIEVGNSAYWLEKTDSINLVSGENTVNLPLQVARVISVREESEYRALVWMDRQRYLAYIVNPTVTTGSPLYWTTFEPTRRENVESPSQPYGQLQMHLWPTADNDHTLQYDAVVRPGDMVDDSDMPIIPIQYHRGLLETAAWFAGAYDVGNKTFAQHEKLASIWIASIKRDCIRHLAGNQRMIPREEYERRMARPITAPPTRIGQLRGG